MTFYLTHHLRPEASLPGSIKTEIKPHHKILDVGCGNGALKQLFPQNTLVGIDKLAASIKLALKAGYNQAHKVDIDTKKLPFKNRSFDVVVCSHVLEHLFQPLFATEEMYRVLKPKGFLFVSVPTRKNKKYDDDYTHVRPFTQHSLETLLKDAGFEKLKFLYQLKGIPGLGIVERFFEVKIDNLKTNITLAAPILRQKVNIEAMAKK